MSPAGQPDPHAKIARSCLGAIILLVLGLSALLACGVYFHIRGLVYFVFVLAALPPVWGTLGLLAYFGTKRRRRR